MSLGDVIHVWEDSRLLPSSPRIHCVQSRQVGPWHIDHLAVYLTGLYEVRKPFATLVGETLQYLQLWAGLSLSGMV